MTLDQFKEIYGRLEATYGPPLPSIAPQHFREYSRSLLKYSHPILDQAVDFTIDNFKPFGRFRWPLPSEIKQAITDLEQTGKLKAPEDPATEAEKRFFEIKAQYQNLPAKEKSRITVLANKQVLFDPSIPACLLDARIKSLELEIFCRENQIEFPGNTTQVSPETAHEDKRLPRHDDFSAREGNDC